MMAAETYKKYVDDEIYTPLELRKNYVCFFILAAFLTLNINPGFGSFEYFPLIAFILIITSGRTTTYHTSLALLLTSASFFTSLSPDNIINIDLTNNIKILIALGFFTFGGLALENHMHAVQRACAHILVAHALYLVIYILSPEIIYLIQKFLGLRGVIYEGKTSFFSSEPSYAAINLMGAYILCIRDKDSTNTRIIKAVIAATCLLSTKSVTATIFVVAIIITNINLKQFTAAALSITGITIASSSSSTNLETDSPILRIRGVLDFAVDNLDQASVKEILNSIEPSGMWRYLVNTANLDIGLARIFGTANLNLTPSLPLLDQELKYLITSNPTYETMPTISTQAILPAFTMFFGLTGFVVILSILLLSICGHLTNNKSQESKLTSIYLIIGAVWQSALTAPIWWMLLSLGLCKIIAANSCNSIVTATNSRKAIDVKL